MRKHLFLLLFTAVGYLFHSQTTAQIVDTLWMKTLGMDGYDLPFEVFQDEDENIVLTGYYSVNSMRKFYLAAFDGNGDTLWTKKIGPDDPSLTPVCAVQTSDGGYMMAGKINGIAPNEDTSDFYFVKTDSGGNVEWEGRKGESEDIQTITSITEIPQGGYFVTGFVWTSSTAFDAALHRISQTGEVEWIKIFQVEGTTSEYANDIVATSDGGFVIAGDAQDINSSFASDVWIVKLDQEGDSLWSQYFGAPYPYEEKGRSIIETSDEGFLVIGEQGQGTTLKDCMVWKADMNGQTEWSDIFGGTYNDIAYNGIELSSGGYAIAGTHYLDDNWKSLLMRYDAGGDTLWTYRWGDPEHSLHAYDVLQLPDGDFVLTGSITESFVTDIFVARVQVSALSVDETELENRKIKVFPNPAHERFTLRHEYLGGDLRIYDVQGKQVYDRILNNTLIKIDVEDWPSGLYTIEVMSKGDKAVEKLIIHHSFLQLKKTR